MAVVTIAARKPKMTLIKSVRYFTLISVSHWGVFNIEVNHKADAYFGCRRVGGFMRHQTPARDRQQ